MLVVRLRSGARGVNGDLPEGVEVLGVVGLALLELDDGNAVTAVVDVSTEHGIVDHLEEGGLVEILTVESVRAVAQQLADLLLSLLVEEEHVRALLGELGILGIGEPVGVVLADADVSNIVAELPADLIVGVEELDGAVLDGEHPGSERSGVVVAADGLLARKAGVLAAIPGLDAGAAAFDAHGVDGWGPHGRDDDVGGDNDGEGGGEKLGEGDGLDLHGCWLWARVEWNSMLHVSFYE